MRVPSKSQKQAITHLSGPAMVIAGPGSGKTFTIIERILYLIRNHHIQPENILVITYTKAAAGEMKERFEKAYTSGGTVNFGTFHSICYQILRQSGIVKENSLMKESDKRKLLQVILGTMGLNSKSGYDEITGLMNVISKRKNLDSDAIFSAVFSDEEMKMIQEEYDRHLREQGLIDFDDMILLCLQLLSSDERSLARYRALFRYILVDEFQDINPPQYEILKYLSHPLDNLFVVGDDDQAIYGFRGATPGIMQQFPMDFGNAKQIMLTENYRCGANIVKLSGEMIGHNKERFAKEFHPKIPEGKLIFQCFDSRREEERAIIQKLSTLKKEELNDTAVILRTNREAALYAGAFKEAKIAIKGSRIKEEDIYHGFLMQDIMAFLAYLYEGNKRSDFICFMNKPNRFLTRMAMQEEKVKLKNLEQYYERNPQMLGKLRIFFKQLQIAEGLNPYLAVSFFRKALGYNEYLRSRAGAEREYQRLCGLADQVQRCFGNYKQGVPVREFIAQRAQKEAGGESQKMLEEDGVHILTMHGSKGLEFERVFLPDLNEGVIPGKDCKNQKELEEERRLLYVAITRAKKELYLYCSRERGRKPSRYLNSISWHAERAGV